MPPSASSPARVRQLAAPTLVEQAAGAEEIIDILPIGVLRFRLGPAETPVCVSANRTFETWAAQPANGLIGLTPERIPLTCDAGRFAAIVAQSLKQRRVARQRLAWSCEAGGRNWHLAADFRLRNAGAAPELVVAVRDRSPELEAETNLKRTMLIDPLTGLPNRLRFCELLEAAIEARGERHVGIIIVNVDRFKRVNASLGHGAGDELLLSIASRLKACLRDEDRVARLAGDEFAILLPRIERESDTIEIVERVRTRVAEPMSLCGGEVHASVSIGVATTGSSIGYAEDMLRDGNFALHQAKRRGGGGGIARYAARDHSRARELFRLEVDLRRALDADELVQAYQPLVELSTGRTIGFEALARWTHREHGAIPPAEFIPVAEDSGLIVPLGRWALRRACTQLADWRRRYPAAEGMSVAVNVSGVQLARDGVVAAVEAALNASGLPGSALKIELTESALVENPERARGMLERLKALGCIIAMDDFGTGYSSLSYLQYLPIDILKIDQSFVAGMLESEDNQKIVKAILSLASALGMTAVAEGIETEAQMHALAIAGCQIGQGYHFARPLSAADAARRIALVQS